MLGLNGGCRVAEGQETLQIALGSCIVRKEEYCSSVATECIDIPCMGMLSTPLKPFLHHAVTSWTQLKQVAWLAFPLRVKCDVLPLVYQSRKFYVRKRRVYVGVVLYLSVVSRMPRKADAGGCILLLCGESGQIPIPALVHCSFLFA